MGQDGLWRAPGSGTPATPGDVASPTADDIAEKIARRLIVPIGPIRTVAVTLGLLPLPPSSYGISTNALNSVINQIVLGGPGIINATDFNAALVTTGAAAGIFEIFDGDVNQPLIRRYPINVGAAGTYNIAYSTVPDRLPFLNGLTVRWTPITAAFGACLINANIDYISIPIGQRGNG